ncbi:MAG: hypothetical protein QQW96_03345 [Tychonema bourrellyi B0820]|uniref:Uncharacterized protein n=1 Tax=Tychonema bourrellyi FEM_GT703 TaxID=2040638 RepID=A0A2G4F586_9CYAN|nr:hypothetical protein [Tychonema bourrellyi]MDQ2096666.1 hypothetical protein [Tychonema bourrellyi B0820]PHX56898.1 hypothetical protein CP500_002660 [Tychonema bourrellyi FEM_GT703]
MTEDAGKKRYIRDFLHQVNSSAGFVDDIRIDRVVRLPGSEGEGSTAKSLSGRQISNLTELLKDDLRHTFDDGYFTFRFVAALVGSGKTSLLTYLHELAKTKPAYQKHSVVVEFQLSVFDEFIGKGFKKELYSHILAHTFYELSHNKELLDSVKNVARKVLRDYLSDTEVTQLNAAQDLMLFRTKFKKSIADNVDSLEEFFFSIVSKVSAVDPNFSFVYLIDELDALVTSPDQIKETRLLFKQLIRRAKEKFGSKIRLLIYLVGTSNNVESFIAEDSVMESLLGESVINLNKGYINEFELIRNKIDERIKGAYKGYKNFSQAWEEIKDITLNPVNTLREFCQHYAGAVLEIHEKYFQEAPEQEFEGNSRQLVESKCRQHWASYLKQKSYTLSAFLTTKKIKGHAFDCYVELLHNGTCVARAFGEAKNYELLSSHLEKFNQWLEAANFKPFTPDGTPGDLSFMIAPSCPPLLERKLELKNIQFIKSDKVIPPPIPTPTSTPIPKPTPTATPFPINLNKANKSEIKKAFNGTYIREKTIDEFIIDRNTEIYCDIDDMAFLGLTPAAKKILQTKFDKGEICF